MVHPPDYDPGEGHDFECQTQYENEAESKCDEGTKCVLGSQCSTKGKNSHKPHFSGNTVVSFFQAAR